MTVTNVVAGIEDPVTGYASMAYTVQGWQGSGDIDKDGKRDFMVSSYYLSETGGNGFWNGGFFLFH